MATAWLASINTDGGGVVAQAGTVMAIRHTDKMSFDRMAFLDQLHNTT